MIRGALALLAVLVLASCGPYRPLPPNAGPPVPGAGPAPDDGGPNWGRERRAGGDW